MNSLSFVALSIPLCGRVPPVHIGLLPISTQNLIELSRNSDIWRFYPRFVVPVFRLLFLTNEQGCHTSVTAAVEENLLSLAKDSALPTIYLQPYWNPQRNDQPISPVFETLGPFRGSVMTRPRLPVDVHGASYALWTVCDDLTCQTR